MAAPAPAPAPEQPQMDTQELRHGYRNLQQQAKSKKADLLRLETGCLVNLLTEANRLHHNVDKPKEHALDAALFETLADAGLDATRKLNAQGSNARTAADLIVRLRTRYAPNGNADTDERAFQWHVLDQATASYFQAAPGINCMLGPLDAQAKVRKVAQRAPKAQVAELVRPDEVNGIGADGTQGGDKDKQETDRLMDEMWGVLQEQGQGGCPVAELVLNPKSFPQTVENLFTLSFLVRDSKVHLSFDPSRGMVAQQVMRQRKGAQQAGGAQGPGEQSQFVLAITMADWEAMCGVVPATDCKMAHRAGQEDHEAMLQQRRQQQQQPSQRGAR